MAFNLIKEVLIQINDKMTNFVKLKKFMLFELYVF